MAFESLSYVIYFPEVSTWKVLVCSKSQVEGVGHYKEYWLFGRGNEVDPQPTRAQDLILSQW